MYTQWKVCDINYPFILTRRYSPLRGLISSSCVGLWPPAEAFFSLRAKKTFFLYPVLACFRQFLVFSSNLSNFKQNLSNFFKNPKNSQKSKSKKLKKKYIYIYIYIYLKKPRKNRTKSSNVKKNVKMLSCKNLTKIQKNPKKSFFSQI